MNKKSNWLSLLYLKGRTNVLSTIMRAFVLFLYCGFTSVYATDSYAETQLDVSLNKGTLEELFDQIHSQSEFIFFYNSNTIVKDQKVTLNLQKSTVRTILNKALVNTDLGYKILDRQIVITTKEAQTVAKTNTKPVLELQDTVTGTVTATGLPLPGANVTVKGTSKGTQTDFDGKFELPATSGDVLVFSYIGFATQEVTYVGQPSLDVALIEDAAALSEVVVTGYTKQNTRNITGAVAVIESEALASTTPQGVEQALQGQASGVTVGSEGGPGGNAAVRIRGYGTINGNDPLYVIDGVQTGQGLTDLNPDDIASIQVLKDAAAASIYGIGAANGVIIITTKGGKKNDKVTFSYNGLTGVDFVPNSVFPDMATPQQLAEAYWQAASNDGAALDHPQYGSGASPILPDYILPEGVIGSVDESTYSFPGNRITRANKEGTNWFDEFFSAAFVQQHNIGITGGSETSKFYMGVGALSQEGVGRATRFDRYNLRVNSEFDVTDRFRIGETLNLSFSDRVSVSDPLGNNSNQNNESQIAALYRMHPIIPVYDIGGNYAGTATIGGVGNGYNAIAVADRNENNSTETLRALGSMYAEFDITEDLLIKTTYTADLRNSKFSYFRPIDFENATASPVNQLRETSVNENNTNWYNILQYTKTFGDTHSLDVFAGTEFKRFSNEEFYANISNFFFTSPDATYISAGTGVPTVGSSQSKASSFSVFGKADYSYDDRYLLSATLRRDESSKFEGSNKEAVFPAASIGWRISGENFLEDSSGVNNLMLKFSWGQLGNNAIPSSRGVTSYGPDAQFYTYAGQTGYYLTNIGDPTLSWETTTTSNIGLTGTFIQNKLNFSLDLYKSVTEDMLLATPVDPTLTGNTVNTIYKNLGQMTNKGFDLSLQYASNSDSDFQYSIGVNVSHYKNNVDFLDKNNPSPIANPQLGAQTGFETTNTLEGYPISSFVGLTWEGIDDTGSAILTGDSRDVIGNPHPDFTYGINFGAEYKSFDFSMFLQGSQGNDIYNLTKFWTDFSNFEGGKSVEYVTNSWSPTNTNGTLPALTLSGNDSTGSSYYIEDGSYLRLKNVALGYSFPESLTDRLGVSKVRVFIQGKNLLTFTNYSGLDPEINLTNYTDQEEANLEIGVDRGAYPVSRSFNLGLNVAF